MADFWQHDPDYPKMSENLREHIRASVEKWLIESPDQALLSFSLHDAAGDFVSILNFTRSVIYVKSVSNVWNTWMIAESDRWPEIISVRGKTIGWNFGEREMPNEIHSMNYSYEWGRQHLWPGVHAKRPVQDPPVVATRYQILQGVST